MQLKVETLETIHRSRPLSLSEYRRLGFSFHNGNNKQGSKQDYEKWFSSRINRRRLIEKSTKAEELFNWIFQVFKDLGYYNSKCNLREEDARVGFLVGKSGVTIRNWRLKLGHFPHYNTYRKIYLLSLMIDIGRMEIKNIVAIRNEATNTKVRFDILKNQMKIERINA